MCLQFDPAAYTASNEVLALHHLALGSSEVRAGSDPFLTWLVLVKRGADRTGNFSVKRKHQHTYYVSRGNHFFQVVRALTCQWLMRGLIF